MFVVSRSGLVVDRNRVNLRRPGRPRQNKRFFIRKRHGVTRVLVESERVSEGCNGRARSAQLATLLDWADSRSRRWPARSGTMRLLARSWPGTSATFMTRRRFDHILSIPAIEPTMLASVSRYQHGRGARLGTNPAPFANLLCLRRVPCGLSVRRPIGCGRSVAGVTFVRIALSRRVLR